MDYESNDYASHVSMTESGDIVVRIEYIESLESWFVINIEDDFCESAEYYPNGFESREDAVLWANLYNFQII